MAVMPSRMSSPSEVGVLLLEQVLRPGVLVDHGGECRLEALDVHATLDGGDAVGVAVDALVVAGVPLHGDVEHLAVVLVFVLELADLGEQRLLGGVEVLDEVDDAALVLVRRPAVRVLRARLRRRSSRPRLRNAIVCRRSSTVRATNSMPSAAKMVGSGQNVMVVPVVRPRLGVSPTTAILPCGLPPLAYSWR